MAIYKNNKDGNNILKLISVPKVYSIYNSFFTDDTYRNDDLGHPSLKFDIILPTNTSFDNGSITSLTSWMEQGFIPVHKLITSCGYGKTFANLIPGLTKTGGLLLYQPIPINKSNYIQNQHWDEIGSGRGEGYFCQYIFVLSDPMVHYFHDDVKNWGGLYKHEIEIELASYDEYVDNGGTHYYGKDSSYYLGYVINYGYTDAFSLINDGWDH